ncbi:hypothetical protein AB0M54_19375 [Actinoplanes sp. NPDC051470]|uniref:hypothetical protein n=1 Tax=Actinoplanes sp. NPDC051470 TaxID=3157224 RepID=UPI00344A3109
MSWVTTFREYEPVYRRAPSAHNTQPWTLSYGRHEIVIGVDPARALPASDPSGRDLALGLGCFLETCLIVAAAAGLPVTCDRSDPRRLRLIPAPGPYLTSFTLDDITSRRVARGPYSPGTISPAFLAGLEPGVTHVPCRALAPDLAVADRWMFSTPSVTWELRSWVRLDRRHPRYHLDGLTDRALALSLPSARLLAAALHVPPAVRRLGVAALLAFAGRGLLRHDGSVLVLTSRGAPVLAEGRRLMRTWLTLARHGLAVHPLSQLLDCPVTAARLTTRVGATPLAVFRVGRPLTEPVRSARLPATSVPGWVSGT